MSPSLSLLKHQKCQIDRIKCERGEEDGEQKRPICKDGRFESESQSTHTRQMLPILTKSINAYTNPRRIKITEVNPLIEFFHSSMQNLNLRNSFLM